jgi:hypothetical protein
MNRVWGDKWNTLPNEIMIMQLRLLTLIFLFSFPTLSSLIAQMPSASQAPPRRSFIEIDRGRVIDAAERFITSCDLQYTSIPLEGKRILVSLIDTLIFDKINMKELFLFDSGQLVSEEIIPCGNTDYYSLFWTCLRQCGEPLKEISAPDGDASIFYLPMAGQEIMIVPQISTDGSISASIVYPFDSTLLTNRESRWVSFANGHEATYFWDTNSFYTKDTILMSVKEIVSDSFRKAQCDTCDFSKYQYSVGWFQVDLNSGQERELATISKYKDETICSPLNRNAKWEKREVFEPLFQAVSASTPPPPPPSQH